MNGCLSPRSVVTLIIDAKPDAPIVANETICENGTITDITPIGGAGSTFTVVGPITSVGPQTLFTQANLQTAGLDATTVGIYNFHIIETSVEGCDSDQSDFDITVSAEPLVTSSTDVTICEGASTTLSVTSIPVDAGTVYTWYDDMALTSSVGTGEGISVSPTITTTYYVTADLNGCVSTTPVSTIVTVTEPLAPTVTGVTVCEGDPTDTDYELSAACIAGETVNWYDAASGGTLLSANSTTYIPMSPTTLVEGTYTYFVECEDANGCVSPKAAVTLITDVTHLL